MARSTWCQASSSEWKPEPPLCQQKVQNGRRSLNSSVQGWTELADSLNAVASVFIRRAHVVVAARHL